MWVEHDPTGMREETVSKAGESEDDACSDKRNLMLGRVLLGEGGDESMDLGRLRE